MPATPSRSNKNGTRRDRRALFSRMRGKASVDGRRKAQERGTYAGKKIERLVRSRAPKHEGDALRAEVREFLRSLRYKRG